MPTTNHRIHAACPILHTCLQRSTWPPGTLAHSTRGRRWLCRAPSSSRLPRPAVKTQARPASPRQPSICAAGSGPQHPTHLRRWFCLFQLCSRPALQRQLHTGLRSCCPMLLSPPGFVPDWSLPCFAPLIYVCLPVAQVRRPPVLMVLAVARCVACAGQNARPSFASDS